MPVSYPYIQYGGLWTVSQQADAKAAGTWPIAIINNVGLYGWGQNNNGQLGLGNRTYYSSPKQVGSLANWLLTVATYNATLATKSDGSLYAWGRNNSGQLGLGNTTNYSSPKQVGALTNWSKISGGNSFFV